MKPDCVIFDWSGTLSDDTDIVYDSAMRILKHHGKPRVPRKRFFEMFVFPPVKLCRRLGIRESEGRLQKLYEGFFRKAGKSLRPKPLPVKRLLSVLTRRGKKIFVVSAHPHNLLLSEARRYGFDSYFEGTYGGVKNKAKKIEAIIRKNRFRKSRVVYVADHVQDIEVAKQVGIRSIAVSWGYNQSEALKRERPDFLAHRPNELISVIR